MDIEENQEINDSQEIVNENLVNEETKINTEQSKVVKEKENSNIKTLKLKSDKDWFKILSLILMAAILITGISIKIGQGTTNTQKWEYKTIKFYADTSNDRTGASALKYNTITVSEAQLNKLGEDGWELVSSDMEMETAYPNFGNNDYVTGIQPNVRPQCLTMVFKRPLAYKSSN